MKDELFLSKWSSNWSKGRNLSKWGGCSWSSLPFTINQDPTSAKAEGRRGRYVSYTVQILDTLFWGDNIHFSRMNPTANIYLMSSVGIFHIISCEILSIIRNITNNCIKFIGFCFKLDQREAISKIGSTIAITEPYYYYYYLRHQFRERMVSVTTDGWSTKNYNDSHLGKM